MSDRLGPSCDHQEGCITCGDEAVELRVVRIDHDRELALCERPADGARETVEIALVQPVSEGDDAAGPRRHRDRARSGGVTR